MKWFIFTGVFLAAIFLSGCAVYHMTRPIFPLNTNPDKTPKLVPSLQPLLSWEPTSSKVVSYDIIIYEMRIDSSKRKKIKRTAGSRIYYRENISGNSHMVQAVLRPDTEYCWTLRIRDGKEISDWATYDYRSFLYISMKANNAFYRFRTPYMRQLSFQPFNPVDYR